MNQWQNIWSHFATLYPVVVELQRNLDVPLLQPLLRPSSRRLQWLDKKTLGIHTVVDLGMITIILVTRIHVMTVEAVMKAEAITTAEIGFGIVVIVVGVK